jgi:Na+/H+-dicarboxylate symporter
MAPLVFFAVLFGLAATRIAPERTERLTAFFDATAQTMLVIVGWVLWLAPFGVFALAFALGARTGLDAVGVLGQYVVVVSVVLILLTLLLYPLAIAVGRRSPARFAQAMAPVQTLAFSTQSSLACLPAMILASERVGVPQRIGGLVIPMAVSLFRITSPAGNMAVAFYVASLYGIEFTALQVIAGVVVAAVVSVGLVGLPSALTFFTALGPIFVTMGIPLEVLPLLLAVESLPDIWRTVGNVTGHVAASTVVDRLSGGGTGPEFDLNARPVQPPASS